MEMGQVAESVNKSKNHELKLEENAKDNKISR